MPQRGRLEQQDRVPAAVHRHARELAEAHAHLKRVGYAAGRAGAVRQPADARAGPQRHLARSRLGPRRADQAADALLGAQQTHDDAVRIVTRQAGETQRRGQRPRVAAPRSFQMRVAGRAGRER